MNYINSLLLFVVGTFLIGCSHDSSSDIKYISKLINPNTEDTLIVDTIILQNLDSKISDIDILIKLLSENANEDGCMEDLDRDHFDVKTVDGFQIAHLARDGCIYYSFLNDSLGVVYAVEFDFYTYKSYSLVSHPEFETRVVDSILNKFKLYYDEYYTTLRKSTVVKD